ncbi:hypothetical protein HYW54_00590 [Candidatus Gottesmanbacteria bacterium]|nr:hypothetical protein [Candidatus Gottesmanbacteria bacterium]
MKKILLAISLLFICKTYAFAKIEVLNPPTKIEINKEFELEVLLTNLSAPIHYLSIALHKKSGDSYFGQTKNGESWVEADDSNCKSFPAATINESSWSGKLTGKYFYNEKDFDSTLGNYILKVIKYTDSCGKSLSDDLNVELYDPNPPPTSTPTPNPTNTPVPTTKSSNIPVPTSTIKPTTTPVKKITSTSIKKVSPGVVLGKTIDLTPTEIPSNSNSNPPIAFILIGLGGTLLLGAGIYTAVIIKKQKQKT